jgi:uncharacterized protein (UPF0248 family)
MITKLTDTEILAWNDRLQDHGLGIIIRPKYVSNTIYSPAIGFDLVTQYPGTTISDYLIQNNKPSWGTNLYQGENIVPEPHIKYNLIFSIDVDKIDKFDEIYNEIKLREIKTPVINGNTNRNINYDRVKADLTTEKHTLFKKEYIKFDYVFEGHLGDIMGYVKHIDDTIEFLQLEPKFKISEVVSSVKDRSMDYLVLKYIYDTSISYKVSEIISNSADTVIKYGRVLYMREKDLTWSRTARIDEVIE